MQMDKETTFRLLWVRFKSTLKTIGAALFQIPNQSIRFAEDPLNKARSEDGIIGFTWWKWVNDPDTDPEW